LLINFSLKREPGIFWFCFHSRITLLLIRQAFCKDMFFRAFYAVCLTQLKIPLGTVEKIRVSRTQFQCRHNS
jgi:hypothetical protein